ncbi:MAG: hypothetical protein NC822_06170 [Candidatus Omnitrophica bacterium]|nr:hypothetical protein [Candidatus Omnitrophota bacterium]
MRLSKEFLFLGFIKIEPPWERIYRRLGYKEGVTKIIPSQKKEIDEDINLSLSYIDLKGLGVSVPIKKINGSKIFLEQEGFLESRDLIKLLKGCDEILFMGATAGRKIIEVIQSDLRGEDLMRAVVLDAVASEMVDASLDCIRLQINNILANRGKYVINKRFSCGYGDFSLQNQKQIFHILEMERLGVNITDTYFLIPEKSVTALSGIKRLNKNSKKI